jgi:hypothetical protein
MNRNFVKTRKNLRWLVMILIPSTIILYLLRGFGILSFVSGGFFLLLIIVSFFFLITFLILKTYA